MQGVGTQLEDFIEGGQNILIITSLENYQSITIELLDFLINKRGLSGVLITVNKSYDMLKQLFEKKNIDLSKLTIVDCISSNKDKRENNSIFLSRPFNATNVSILIEQLSDNPSNKFFIFDTLTTIISYDAINIVKFFKYNLTTLASKGKLTILLGVDLDLKDKNVVLIAQSTNKIIKV